jgi:exosortase D (VPLPA-CTERM-specific)
MFGLVLSLYGIRGLKKLFLPLFAFILIVPLPAFLTRNIISIFHNITTEISLLLIRWVGVSVYNEGNHIDFDGYQIEIDKVTNYETIFPYIVFTYLMILVLDISRKKVIIVVISALCILIFTNSIQVIAASLLHVYLDARTINIVLQHFNGSYSILFSLVVLSIMALLVCFYNSGTRNLNAFFIGPTHVDKVAESHSTDDIGLQAMPIAASSLLLFMSLIGFFPTSKSDYILPQNKSYNQFPMQIGEWVGKMKSMVPSDVKSLQFTDYVLADYRNNASSYVTLLLVYYASQSPGRSSHSPRTCLPGSGWAMRNQTQESFEVKNSNQRPIKYNRIKAIKGESKQLVYYWYQQRGRNITNEFLVKWYLFLDAVLNNRTDGALVRITTPLGENETWEDADRRQLQFMSQINQVLLKYIPN